MIASRSLRLVLIASAIGCAWAPGLAAARGRGWEGPDLPTLPDGTPFPKYVASARASAGMWAWTRLGVEGEYWLSDMFGVGGTAAWFHRVTSWSQLESGSPRVAPVEDAHSALFLPTLDFRRRPEKGTFFASAGAGAGFARRDKLAACDSGCARSATFGGFAFGAALGGLFHPGYSGFEIGPVARYEALVDVRGRESLISIFTLNMEIGWAKTQAVP